MQFHKNRIPYLYLERTTLNVTDNTITLSDGSTIPAARISCLLLGPGTSVTHEAMKILATNDVRVNWVGEECVKIYAAGDPLSTDSVRILAQAIAYHKPSSKTKVLQYLYEKRFNTKPPPNLTAETFRGIEGTRCRQRYLELAALHGIPWSKREARSRRDTINLAIDIANGYMYNVATTAILAAGFSPSIGFVHSGFDRAFAADIVDIFKFDVSVPLAFEVVASKPQNLHTAIRHKLRDTVKHMKLVDTMIQVCQECIHAGAVSTKTK